MLKPNTVVLVDMLDQTTQVPIELCFTREVCLILSLVSWTELFALPVQVFDGFLKLYFRDRAGSMFVRQGDYDLMADADNQLIDDTTWSAMVRPGKLVNMSAILRLRLHDRRLCPSCRKLNIATDMELNGGIKWSGVSLF